MSPSTRFDPDAFASLEAERDFLLRSIADLDAERDAGNLDDERYARLRDDYTARAAAVLRSMDEGRDAAQAPLPVPRRRSFLTGGAVIAFVLVAALALSAAAGQRHNGQTLTGNAQSTAPAAAPEDQADLARRGALERQVRDHPDDAAAHLVYARYLLEVERPEDAVREYVATVKLDPKNPEANAYAGWLSFLVAQGANATPQTATQLTDFALARLDAAVAIDGAYPDARFFRGFVQFRGRKNPGAAVADFERYLALVPSGPFTDQVRALLDQARQGG